tara:strand:- start:1080 stop:2930 length:1851 start_codon:yes stop_codon:yes gene_type:complete
MASKAIGFLNFKFSADLSNFERAMKKAQKNLNKFGKNIKKTGQTLTRNLTLPLAGFGLASLKFGSDLQETSSKFSQVFSSLRDEAEKTSKEFQKSFGLSELSAKGMLSSTGDLLVGFGFTEKAALELSDQVNRLSVDLASFSNFEGGAEGASKALTKALVGETESAKALGIVIRQGTKEYKDRTLAIMKEQGVTILQAKAINNLEIAYSQSQKAIGDYARTSGDFANQLRFLKEQFIDLSAQLGQKLIPFAQKVLDVFKKLIIRFQNLSDKTKDFLVVLGLVLSAIGPLLFIFGQLAISAAALIPVFTAIVAILFSIPSIIAGAIAALGFFATSSSNLAVDVRNHFVDMVNGIILAINDMIAALNIVSSLFGKFIPFINLLEREEHKLQETNKELNKALDGTLKIIKDLQSEKGFEGLTKTTNKYNESLDPLIKNIKEYAENFRVLGSSMEGVDLVTGKLTKAQSLLHAGYEMFGDVVGNSMNEAIDSQESFFSVFIKNIKRAIRSLLVQLAVLTLIKVLMGDSRAFTAASMAKSFGQIMNVPEFAEGGLVTGPTTALIGEGIGTNSGNPEVVAPLNKLRQFMGGGNNNIVVTGKLVGNDIYLSNQNASINRRRTV